MSKVFTTSIGVAFALVLASSASGQTLGEVAKKEEARRQAVKGTSKVYTNDTLKGDPTPAAPAVPPATSAAPAPTTAKPAEKPAEADPKRNEAYWKDRIKTARAELDRAKMFNEALQSRINGLSTDFAARSDPYQREQISQDRQKALAEFERTKKEIATLEKEIKDIEEEARKAGVPPGWLR
jgi:hypothetical protein